jgi:hypothetical protein
MATLSAIQRCVREKLQAHGTPPEAMPWTLGVIGYLMTVLANDDHASFFRSQVPPQAFADMDDLLASTAEQFQEEIALLRAARARLVKAYREASTRPGDEDALLDWLHERLQTELSGMSWEEAWRQAGLLDA